MVLLAALDRSAPLVVGFRTIVPGMVNGSVVIQRVFPTLMRSSVTLLGPGFAAARQLGPIWLGGPDLEPDLAVDQSWEIGRPAYSRGGVAENA